MQLIKGCRKPTIVDMASVGMYLKPREYKCRPIQVRHSNILELVRCSLIFLRNLLVEELCRKIAFKECCSPKMTSDCLRQISLEAVRAVHPTSLIRQFVHLRRIHDDENNVVLSIEGKTFRIDSERGCHVVGFGKAVLGMAAELTR